MCLHSQIVWIERVKRRPEAGLDGNCSWQQYLRQRLSAKSGERSCIPSGPPIHDGLTVTSSAIVLVIPLLFPLDMKNTRTLEDVSVRDRVSNAGINKNQLLMPPTSHAPRTTFPSK